MLRIVMEARPSDGRPSEILGECTITNITGEQSSLGDYHIVLSTKKEEIHGNIVGFERSAKGPWELLMISLQEILKTVTTQETLVTLQSMIKESNSIISHSLRVQEILRLMDSDNEAVARAITYSSDVTKLALEAHDECLKLYDETISST